MKQISQCDYIISCQLTRVICVAGQTPINVTHFSLVATDSVRLLEKRTKTTLFYQPLLVFRYNPKILNQTDK